jgi:hypothetical protein
MKTRIKFALVPMPHFRIGVLLFFGLTLPMICTASCIKPGDPANTWTWGLGGGVAWLQYGNPHSKKMVFSLLRSPQREAINMVLHDASAAGARGQEIPGFVSFSFEGGFHTGKDKDIVAVEGVGRLDKHQDQRQGDVGLFAGTSLAWPQDDLHHYHQASRAAKGAFRFYVIDTCYEIPLPGEPHRVMNTLLSAQKIFSEEAARLFPDREGNDRKASKRD